VVFCGWDFFVLFFLRVCSPLCTLFSLSPTFSSAPLLSCLLNVGPLSSVHLFSFPLAFPQLIYSAPSGVRFRHSFAAARCEQPVTGCGVWPSSVHASISRYLCSTSRAASHVWLAELGPILQRHRFQPQNCLAWHEARCPRKAAGGRAARAWQATRPLCRGILPPPTQTAVSDGRSLRQKAWAIGTSDNAPEDTRHVNAAQGRRGTGALLNASAGLCVAQGDHEAIVARPMARPMTGLTWRVPEGHAVKAVANDGVVAYVLGMNLNGMAIWFSFGQHQRLCHLSYAHARRCSWSRGRRSITRGQIIANRAVRGGGLTQLALRDAQGMSSPVVGASVPSLGVSARGFWSSSVPHRPLDRGYPCIPETGN